MMLYDVSYVACYNCDSVDNITIVFYPTGKILLGHPTVLSLERSCQCRQIFYFKTIKISRFENYLRETEMNETFRL